MASIWREPIFDRTYDDVVLAIRRIGEWKKSHTHASDVKVENNAMVINEGEVSVNDDSIELSGEGVAYVENNVVVADLGAIYDLKGCLNLSDLTRIEDNIKYLATILAGYHYLIDVKSKEWTKDSLPKLHDMERISNNIRALFEGFVTPSATATVPNAMLSYQDINALEYDLYLLKQAFDAMLNLFVKSGTRKSGSTNHLPLRR